MQLVRKLGQSLTRTGSALTRAVERAQADRQRALDDFLRTHYAVRQTVSPIAFTWWKHKLQSAVGR